MDNAPGVLSTESEVLSRTEGGIRVDAEGNRVITATRRPDGTWRKEIRIRPGYVRDEERQRFVTKGTEVRTRA